jgi:hypothetical protein
MNYLVLRKGVKKLRKLNSAFAILLIAFTAVNAQSTDPVGYVNLKISAGSGGVKKLTYLSFPLLDKDPAITGKTAGTITEVTSTTINDQNAGWAVGALSAPATPYLIGITSGTAAGRIFHIASSAATAGAVGAAGSANTATQVTISTLDTGSGIDLAAVGVKVGDSYQIYACDTLGSLLPLSAGILSGASVGVSDSVLVVVNGSANTYWYSSTLARWTKSGVGNPDASNTPILPNMGIAYSRLANTDINLTAIGTVPSIARKVQIKNSGLTLLAVYFPADTTISSLGLQNLSGWVTHATSANTADKIVVVSSGTASTYWYTGSNWKKSGVGSPNSDITVIPVGAMVYVNKVGTFSGYSTFTQVLPYTL